MVSQQILQPTSKSVEPGSSPARISFSAEFLDDNNFISICPNQAREPARDRNPRNVAEFEFLSGNSSNMITADELISEGKLLPFWQTHNAEKLKNITLKEQGSEEKGENDKEEARISRFLDDDPSPRPPKCTVLWKELLKLRKQRCSSTLSPSSSSSSSRNSMADVSSDEKKGNGIGGNKEKDVKIIKKGLERTKSASIRIRPVINLPICTTQGKSSSLPPLFPLKRGKLERL